jgi:hypothetical protein
MPDDLNALKKEIDDLIAAESSAEAKYLGARDKLNRIRGARNLAEIELKKATGPRLYDLPLGKWHVTTEGDCEGRSVVSLGLHDGHIVDIAKAFSGHAMYGLHFVSIHDRDPSAMNTEPRQYQLAPTAERAKVWVGLPISTGTWDLVGDERIAWFKAFLARPRPEAPFDVTGTHFSGVELTFFKTTYQKP